MVVSGQTAYYLKLDVCATVEDAGRLGAVLRPRQCLADSAGVDLAPMAFRRSADLAARERWDDDARVLDLLERRKRRLPMAADVRRLVVGLSGSSAPQLGDRFLRLCREIDGLETHLVMSAGARRSVELEMGEDPSAIEALADVVLPPGEPGRRDLLRVVPHRRHGGDPLLDGRAGRDRRRYLDRPAPPRRRRDPQGAASAHPGRAGRPRSA